MKRGEKGQKGEGGGERAGGERELRVAHLLARHICIVSVQTWVGDHGKSIIIPYYGTPYANGKKKVVLTWLPTFSS